MLSYEAVVGAAARLAKTPVRKTPLVEIWEGVYCKLENTQVTGSFKARGAANKVLQTKGSVVCHSAGNHGAAVAWAAKLRGVECTVVVPRTAPEAKKALIRKFGAAIVETDHARRAQAVREIVDRTGASMVHPFDDLDVIAGQGTLALELPDDLDAVVVPVSGGGLAAGIATVLGGDKVFLVEPEGKGLGKALAAGNRLLDPSMEPLAETIADGMRSRALGERPWGILSAKIPPSRVLSVSNEAILEAMALTFQDLKTVCEPSGATALAALLEHRDTIGARRRIGLVVCGGNLDVPPMLRRFYRL
ncbi:hypothetical protein CTAYLR_000660 [Chrysophaeum taylorii]|uniref:Tryptophan synthase beta chain-like PALP domain-containing protein n=1 Tax=Chrysophaeum taylorii TaxID=2483200 RepID=A0AAD7UB07_9STRA|nr:hypothetical protein CTAYLR_000660 [Chrysophaeum taylorii]